jgi:NCAIR mutase (PurE)-related protein
MDPAALRALLEGVRRGEVEVDAALGALRDLPFRSLGFATVDHHRALRTGHPEVVFGAGKTPAQIEAIFREITRHDQDALATRVDEAGRAHLRAAFPDAEVDDVARTVLVRRAPWRDRGIGRICVVSAGTSDLPVAREAIVTARALGNVVDEVFDVGVAGLHRLLAHRAVLDAANVLVVVAGMEAALASVVGGLVARPVIAVPTSVGYGAHFRGLTALLGMLNSCASGVTVVNIDNGFGGGFAASLVNRRPDAGASEAPAAAEARR